MRPRWPFALVATTLVLLGLLVGLCGGDYPLTRNLLVAGVGFGFLSL